MDRRDFLKSTGATVALSAVGGAAKAEEAAAGVQVAANDGQELKKAITFSMLPDSLSMADRLKLARDAGFDGVEVKPISDDAEIKSLRAAADKTGVEVHSIIYGGWHAPLSSPDESIADRGEAAVADALRCARELGADNVLLVPAVVNATTRYTEAYDRSQKRIRRLIPVAEKMKVRILVENVWNNFLLSPLEFARYVDELDSPWVQAYFDVGNVVVFGWPEDWILTLGHRIKKVHLKDFQRGPRQFCNLRDGDVNWQLVRKALSNVGYRGYLTAELDGGDETYLRDVSARIQAIINEKI